MKLANGFINLLTFLFLKQNSGLQYSQYCFTKFITCKRQPQLLWRLTLQVKSCKRESNSRKSHVITFMSSSIHSSRRIVNGGSRVKPLESFTKKGYQKLSEILLITINIFYLQDFQQNFYHIYIIIPAT